MTGPSSSPTQPWRTVRFVFSSDEDKADRATASDVAKAMLKKARADLDGLKAELASATERRIGSRTSPRTTTLTRSMARSGTTAALIDGLGRPVRAAIHSAPGSPDPVYRIPAPGRR